MIDISKAEAVRFHRWLLDPNISNHKWEILQLLDRIIGHCPTEKKKETVHGKLNKGGAGEG